MDKGLTLQKWVLINWQKIPQMPKNVSAQIVKFSMKKDFIGRLQSVVQTQVLCFYNQFPRKLTFLRPQILKYVFKEIWHVQCATLKVLVNLCPVLSEFFTNTFDILAKIVNEYQIQFYFFPILSFQTCWSKVNLFNQK